MGGATVSVAVRDLAAGPIWQGRNKETAVLTCPRQGIGE